MASDDSLVFEVRDTCAVSSKQESASTISASTGGETLKCDDVTEEEEEDDEEEEEEDDVDTTPLSISTGLSNSLGWDLETGKIGNACSKAHLHPFKSFSFSLFTLSV